MVSQNSNPFQRRVQQRNVARSITHLLKPVGTFVLSVPRSSSPSPLYNPHMEGSGSYSDVEIGQNRAAAGTDPFNDWPWKLGRRLTHVIRHTTPISKGCQMQGAGTLTGTMADSQKGLGPNRCASLCHSHNQTQCNVYSSSSKT
jgi:hypothetical protein